MNWWGLLVSFTFVFGFIGLAQVLLERGRLSPSVTRKVVHVGVAHWWLLAMLFFDRWQFAIVGPLAFIFINLASYLFRLFPAMEHEERRRNLGTIYFPVSLLVLVLLTWAGPLPIWVGGLGVLVLGWGDGLAAIIGQVAKSRTFTVAGNTKSLAGSLAMFVFSTAVAAVFLALFALPSGAAEPIGVLAAAGLAPWTMVVLRSLAVAAVATTVELVTPWGLDNLTIPIVTAFFVYLV